MTICTVGKKIREKQKFLTPLEFQTVPFSNHLFRSPPQFQTDPFFGCPPPHIRTRMRVCVEI